MSIKRRELLTAALTAGAWLALPPGVRRVAAQNLPAPTEPRPSAPTVANRDALHTRVREELKRFTTWLEREKVRGLIGEAGWPDDRHGHHSWCPDPKQKCEGAQSLWNELAEVWFGDADRAGLWVTVWATGQWWGDYALAAYEALRPDKPVSIANTQAAVIERHLSTAGYQRGISVCGGEFGEAPSDTTEEADNFSNTNPGVYGDAYHYDLAETFQYLAGRGLTLVRIPFRWERLQPRLGERLDAAELTRLKDVVRRARAARTPALPGGLKVILDMHNFGAYYRSERGNPKKGIRRDIGLGEVTGEQFADVWQRISNEFKADPEVFYGLMCEPVDAETADRLNCEVRTPAVVRWEKASQEATNVIRRNGDKKLVVVSGYCYSGVTDWAVQHPNKWIDDRDNNHIYEAHHYWG